jgi:LEA14-like dessication related protein
MQLGLSLSAEQVVYMNKFLKLNLLCLVTLALTSCSLFSKPQDVGVSLADIALAEVTLLNTTLETKVRLENESNETLQVRGAVLKLYINGDYVGKGMAKFTQDIPSYETREFSLPIRLSNFSMARNLQDWVGEAGFSYRLEGRIDRPYSSVPVSVSDSYRP